ncbi:hypothetical protein KUCAC02_006436 [Chaenocephalus aceratus]|uniref:Uncharacterized protein n=1 Tax=Chaenocephalus aceratus TaxID=36190 RepID=A0ACB9VRQ0_CHAAC|nr:hypothetical protein KUCAC02_006436 [Chaenocephalus aceratus]
MPSKHPEDDVLLQRANKQITDLKEDIRRLSDKLKEKESLVSGLMEVASVQSKQLASFSATTHDTVLWDPSTCPRPSDCSTPGHQQSWSEVVRKSFLNGVTSPPRLGLRNRFAALWSGPEGSFSRSNPFVQPEDTPTSAQPAHLGAPVVSKAALANLPDPRGSKGAL